MTASTRELRGKLRQKLPGLRCVSRQSECVEVGANEDGGGFLLREPGGDASVPLVVSASAERDEDDTQIVRSRARAAVERFKSRKVADQREISANDIVKATEALRRLQFIMRGEQSRAVTLGDDAAGESREIQRRRQLAASRRPHRARWPLQRLARRRSSPPPSRAECTRPRWALARPRRH